MDYAFNFQGKNFTPNGTDVADSEAHNAKVEAAELAAWSLAPDQFAVYVDAKAGTVTTWTGKVLGSIIEHRSFRTNMSRNMVALRFRGTNGATYYGRYGADWSQLCLVRKAKGS